MDPWKRNWWLQWEAWRLRTAVAHGRSGSPVDSELYSETLTVGDMAALLDHLGCDKAIVGGLSLGGYMSLAFNAEHPERVAALLIIDTGPGYKKDAARENWNVQAGAEDEPFLAATSYMASKIPNAQKCIIPDAGHAVNLDQPEAFDQAVRGFLTRHNL